MSTTSQASNMADEDFSSIEKFKLALEDGCDLHACDAFGLNIILRAAVGDTKKALGKEPFLAVLDFLLERDDIPRIDKIDALELAGAILLSHDGNHAKFALAFQYWRRALSLRLMDTEGGPIYKTLLQYKNGQLSEWCSLDDIQRIEQNPADRQLQALLVRLRILTGISWRAACVCLFLPSYTSVSQILRKGMHGGYSISQTLDVTRIVIDTTLRSVRPHARDLKEALIDIVEMVINTFSSFRFESSPPNLSSEDFEKFVEIVLMDLSYGCLPLNDSNNLEEAVVPIRHLIYLFEMLKILLQHHQKITETITKSLRQLVQRDGRDPSGQNLLLLACHRLGSMTGFTVPFLLYLGASPIARDIKGNGVFHILALTGPQYSYCGNDEIRDGTARWLLERVHGHGLDMVNEDGMTAADLWFQTNTPGKKDVTDLPAWLQESEPKPRALRCLSAAAVRRHKIHYEEKDLPAVLSDFVLKH